MGDKTLKVCDWCGREEETGPAGKSATVTIWEASWNFPEPAHGTGEVRQELCARCRRAARIAIGNAELGRREDTDG